MLNCRWQLLKQRSWFLYQLKATKNTQHLYYLYSWLGCCPSAAVSGGGAGWTSPNQNEAETNSHAGVQAWRHSRFTISLNPANNGNRGTNQIKKKQITNKNIEQWSLRKKSKEIIKPQRGFVFWAMESNSTTTNRHKSKNAEKWDDDQLTLKTKFDKKKA